MAAPAATGDAAACQEQVVADWAADGSVDGVYDLPCYEAAITSLPPDLRDYTDAAEVIRRALTTALRSVPAGPEDDAERSLAGSASAQPPTASASVATPLAAVLGAVAVLALGIGALAAVVLVRRRRSDARAEDREGRSGA